MKRIGFLLLVFTIALSPLLFIRGSAGAPLAAEKNRGMKTLPALSIAHQGRHC